MVCRRTDMMDIALGVAGSRENPIPDGGAMDKNLMLPTGALRARTLKYDYNKS